MLVLAILDARASYVRVWVQSVESYTHNSVQPLPLTALGNRSARTPPPPQATDPWFVALRQVRIHLYYCTFGPGPLLQSPGAERAYHSCAGLSGQRL